LKLTSVLFNTTPQPTLPELIAAVDLGSNSFHLIVASVQGGELAVIDRLRETVRLGAGLNPAKELTEPAQERALACLERFGQRLSGMPAGSVRAVGTNTLRLARNSSAFLDRAEQALGHSIEVIAGREEARLIYLGVAHGLEAGTERRLVVDIGGGSTEIITGHGFDITHRESLHVGCVNLSLSHFPNGEIKRKYLQAAELEAELAIQPVAHMFRGEGWDRALGSSGTIRCIADIAHAQGWCRQGITRKALEKLREGIVAAGHVDKLSFAGLDLDRRPILPGGVAVLWAVFDLLGIEAMDVSDEALREGVLYDLIGRIHHSDVRDRTVRAMAQRWGVYEQHALRVRNTAAVLFELASKEWGLQAEGHGDMLAWAANLHEVGLTISHGQYHKHGAYIVQNADLSGFSRREQGILSVLVRAHRRKFPVEALEILPKRDRRSVRYLCVLLRLAVLLHRSRAEEEITDLAVLVQGDRVALEFPEDWLTQRPLTVADLENEAEYLASAGFTLTFH